MPIYTYQCKSCGQQLDILRSIHQHDVPPSSDEVREITVCGESHALERIIKGTSFVLVGGGWFGRGGY